MKRSLRWLVGLLLGAALGMAGAQSLRDPTLPPVEAGVAGAPNAANSLRFDSSATTMIVRKGRRYLVVGTRLYATGEKLGHARIVRITETELWLRESGVLRKLPFFDGIERRAVAVPGVNAGKSSTRTPSPGVAPAAEVRP